MAGTENTGFENSCSDLFNNAKWVIIREDNEENDVNKVADFIKILGASPIFCNADEHDVAVALISHMPLLISQAIYLTAGNNELAKQLASSGFRDMTRLALSSPQMASDMLNFNGKYIKNALAVLGQNVEKLLDNDYFEYCEKIREERKKMYDINGKNVYIGEVKND